MATSVPAAGSWEAARAPLLLCAAVLAAAAARALAEWAWLRPRRLGRALRAQGLRGTAYRPLAGDAPLADRLAREARSRPPLPPGCHAVVPRAAPLFHHAIPEHGTCVAAFDLLSRRRRPPACHCWSVYHMPVLPRQENSCTCMIADKDTVAR